VTSEYTVKRTGAYYEASVICDGKSVARLGKKEPYKFDLQTTDGSKDYVLDPKVDGRIRPFSIAALDQDKVVLKILNSLFAHGGQMYLMKNVPEGNLPRNHLLGVKFITRLVNFPFQTPEAVEIQTLDRLGRHRGVRVGEMSGLGITGHKVKLESELDDIGLPLSAASYLIYASG
jgi:hypothetical protein